MAGQFALFYAQLIFDLPSSKTTVHAWSLSIGLVGTIFFSNHRADTVSDYAEGVMHCVHHLRSVLSLIDDKVSVES